MTKEELDNLIAAYKEGFVSFDEVIGAAEEDTDDIHDRESLLDLAIYHIKHDGIYLALHILKAVDSEWTEYYHYDVTMGILDTPTGIASVEDLYDYVD